MLADDYKNDYSMTIANTFFTWNILAYFWVHLLRIRRNCRTWPDLKVKEDKEVRFWVHL